MPDGKDKHIRSIEGVDELLERFSTALRDGTAGVFAGAGVSAGAGLPGWSELLRPLARGIKLDVDEEHDLVAVAQYVVNAKGGNRGDVTRALKDAVDRGSPTDVQRLLATLPVPVIWTTNYDDLIERALAAAGKRVDVKRRTAGLSTPTSGRDVIVYKMHGDVTELENAVLTRDDYEAYDETRGLFTTTLLADLAARTFLFLGFSFTDANIDRIRARLRALISRNAGTHYWVTREPKAPKAPADQSPEAAARHARATAAYERERRLLPLRIADLARYGIQTVVVPEYDDVPRILRELGRLARMQTIFVSGSAHAYGTMGRDRVEELAAELGREIIRRGYNLTTGLGLGIGHAVYAGAFEQLYRLPADAARLGRINLRPLPHGLPTAQKPAAYTQWRREIIGTTGFTVILCGNRRDPTTGATIAGPGVEEEYRLAVDLGSYPIPIGATGAGAPASRAMEYWQTAMNRLGTDARSAQLRPHLEVLGDPARPAAELVAAVFGVIDVIKAEG